MRMFKRNRLRALFAALLIAFPGYAFAHVKWFSDYSYAERPLSFDEIMTPLFGLLFAASVVSIAGIVVLDERLTQTAWYRHLVERLRGYASRSDLVLRVAVGGVLLLSWQSGAMLVPEIPSSHVLVDFVQLLLAILILSNRFTQVAGYGLIGLYILAYWKYGALHILDYIYLVGAAYYLIASQSKQKKIRASGLPVLYASVGFSLCWVALEKLVYPQWALSILQDRPFLTMGFDPNFFLTSAAFVEFTLGFLLIVCLIQRPIAIAVTGLFMTTTMVFGKLEFVGHAIVHAAMIVFILQGRGETFRTPITFFYHMWQRVAFSIVAFTAMYALMLGSYDAIATDVYLASKTMDHDMPMARAEWEGPDAPPALAVDVTRDAAGGWNVHLIADGFTFVPELAGQEPVQGEGHAHLYIDDRKIARMYSPWHYVAELSPGTHTFMVTLNSNDHKLYAYQGHPIVARCTVVVE
ncbi:MAG: hypothetical protein R2834_00575 [Rhodothermales bacterium]